MLLATALVLGACTAIPNDEVATVKDPSGAPDALLSPTTTSETIPNPAVDTFQATVYLFDEELSAVVPAARTIPAPATIEAVIKSLFEDDLNPEEIEAGLSNAVPQAADVASVELSESGRVATIDVNEAWVEAEGERITRAIAQIVYTVTDESWDGGSIEKVQFRVEGEARPAPDGEGRELNRVERIDYQAFDLEIIKQQAEVIENATTSTIAEETGSTPDDAPADDGTPDDEAPEGDGGPPTTRRVTASITATTADDG